MEWLIPAVLVAVVVLSATAVAWCSARKAWNVDRDDDRRRQA